MKRAIPKLLVVFLGLCLAASAFAIWPENLMTWWQIFKIGITRGYILIGIFGICIALLLLISIAYGDPATITTDPEYPLGERGRTRYMGQEQYDRVYFWRDLVMRIGFISGLTGFALYFKAHGLPR